jgi:hypothetical protein
MCSYNLLDGSMCEMVCHFKGLPLSCWSFQSLPMYIQFIVAMTEKYFESVNWTVLL